MQGSAAFGLAKGKVKSVNFTDSSVVRLTGGAELFNGSTSTTRITVDGSTFEHFKGTAASQDLLGLSGAAVTLSNSVINNITDLRVGLVDGETVELNSVTVQ